MSDFSSNFINLEYSLDAYFEKHMAMTVVEAKKYLDRKQSEEIRAYLDRARGGTGGFGNSMLHVNMAIQDASINGSYNKIHTEQLIEGIIKQFSKDQRLSADIGMMTALWRGTAVAQLGEERYKQLSAQCPCGDLACQYIDERISRLIIDRLAKMNMPKSTLEYILSEGGKGSVIGMVYNWTYDNSSKADKMVRERTEQLYNPSTGKKLGAEAVAFVLDGWMAAGKVPLAAAKFLGVDALIRGAGMGAGKLLSDDGLSELDRMIGQSMFGSQKALGELRSETKAVRPQESEDMLFLNESLNKKIFKPAVNQHNVKDVRNSLESAVAGNGSDLLARVFRGLSSFGMKVKESPVPAWMDKMSEKQLIKTGAFYTAYAMEMKAKNVSTIKVGKVTMTLQEMAQRAYDYARAANERCLARQPRQQAQGQKASAVQDPNLHQAVYVQQQADPAMLQTQFQQHYETAYQQPMAGNGQQASSFKLPSIGDLGGWSSFLDKAGIGGLGSLGSNLGSTIAMLPELMMGLFTGKIPGFSMKDNMLPLGMLMTSLLFGRRMNPLLKFLLLGLGGAMLLNNASKVVKGDAESRPDLSRTYRRYDDEPLSPRLSNVEIKGNTILADVDGVPTILTIKSDRVLDAYNKGAIPLNTLCNAVLRNYDQMDVKVSENYERVAARRMEEQQQEQQVRIK